MQKIFNILTILDTVALVVAVVGIYISIRSENDDIKAGDSVNTKVWWEDEKITPKSKAVAKSKKATKTSGVAKTYKVQVKATNTRTKKRPTARKSSR